MNGDPSFLIVDVLLNISGIEIPLAGSAGRKRRVIGVGTGSGYPVSPCHTIRSVLDLPILPIINAILVTRLPM
jgi:hypothetical protein